MSEHQKRNSRHSVVKAELFGKPLLESTSVKIIRSAIDRGSTFMDNCWDCHDGKSEIRMGKALRDGYRNRVFLMTKIDGRSRSGAAAQINECLTRPLRLREPSKTAMAAMTGEFEPFNTSEKYDSTAKHPAFLS